MSIIKKALLAILFSTCFSQKVFLFPEKNNISLACKDLLQKVQEYEGVFFKELVQKTDSDISKKSVKDHLIDEFSKIESAENLDDLNLVLVSVGFMLTKLVHQKIYKYALDLLDEELFFYNRREFWRHLNLKLSELSSLIIENKNLVYKNFLNYAADLCSLFPAEQEAFSNCQYCQKPVLFRLQKMSDSTPKTAHLGCLGLAERMAMLPG